MLTSEELDIAIHFYDKLIENNKNDDLFVDLLTYCLNRAKGNTLRPKNIEKYIIELDFDAEYHLQTDLPLMPVVKVLFDHNFGIKKTSYYDAPVNYSVIEFLSVDSCLLFLDLITEKKDKLFERIESSESQNIKNKWKFYVRPYCVTGDTHIENLINKDYNVHMFMSVIIPDNDLPVIYNKLTNRPCGSLIKDNLIDEDNPSFGITYSQHEYDDLKLKITDLIQTQNNPILTKILEYSNEHLRQKLIRAPEERTDFSYNKKVYHIHKKLIPLAKELLAADIDINDCECAYEHVDQGYCCVSLSYYSYVVEFVNIITAGHDNDKLYKHILGIACDDKLWKYEIYAIDINHTSQKKNTNKLSQKKTDFSAYINMIIPYEDIKILTLRLKNYNKFVSYLKNNKK
jgi:hypothetical protein